MCFESLSPTFWNVLPPSVDFHTPSPHDVRLAVVRLAGADPDDVRVLLRHGDVADRQQAVVLRRSA